MPYSANAVATGYRGHRCTAALPDAVAMEADHRVANNLAIIAALIRSQAATCRKSRCCRGPTSAPLRDVRQDRLRRRGCTACSCTGRKGNRRSFRLPARGCRRGGGS